MEIVFSKNFHARSFSVLRECSILHALNQKNRGKQIAEEAFGGKPTVGMTHKETPLATHTFSLIGVFDFERLFAKRGITPGFLVSL
jgi:hypothetical protein